jgi:D-sedoheptulose 7-phosphate isomerase
MRSVSAPSSIALIEARLLARNRLSGPFFERHGERLARAARCMAERFGRGGRLLAFGRRQYATDAQHIEVEFVHPVLVGKRALPALDLSPLPAESLRAIVRPDDMVMVLGPPEGDRDLTDLLAWARGHGALTFALPGTGADFSIEPSTIDPFVHQELIEILYHTLWETVHVFLEHRGLGHEAGPADFLYPFLGRQQTDGDELVGDVAASIRAKAADDEQLRLRVARDEGTAIGGATFAIHDRLQRGGAVLLFGNGGSATDANDWALDCVASPKGYEPVRAFSLAMAAASLSALANDIGPEEIFLRQVIAHGRRGDVAIAISTSGGSRNVTVALEEARRRGMLTVALLGHDGGDIARRGLADIPIIVRSDYVPRIQEVQASIYHVMLDLLEAVRRGDVTDAGVAR